MKKNIILRSLLGGPLGLTISYVITLVISVCMADGHYYPVSPELIEKCGSEINAVVVQAVLSFLCGAMWGGMSVMWEMEEWSLLRMTATHLVTVSVVSFPMAWIMEWLPHNVPGAVSYFGIFFGIYLGIWVFRYKKMKCRVAELNRVVQERGQ